MTLRSGESAATLKHSATVQVNEQTAELSNGLIRVRVDPSGIRLDRLTDEGPRPICDTFELAVTRDGRRDVGRIESHDIIAVGPVRSAVDILGRHDEAGLDFRLRLEVFAESPVCVMRYWFFHQVPGVEQIDIDAIGIELPMHTATGRHHFVQSQHGLQCVLRSITTDRPLDMRVGEDETISVRLADVAPLDDPTEYPPYLMPPQDLVEPWLAGEAEHGWVTATMDDFKELKPKAMRLGDGRLACDVWPTWAGSLELPQGRSRSVTLRLGVSAPGDPPMHPVALLSATRCDRPVLLDPSAYAATDAFGQGRVLAAGQPGAIRFDDYLKKTACPPTVCDFMDLGDTRDPGYSRTYLTTGRRLKPIVPPEQARPLVIQTDHYAAEWCDLSQFEKVWTNNEYDIVWCIGGEMLRSSRPELFQSLRWFSRHAIDVDFVHYSDHSVKHRSTPPHCARHTTAGTYPSHLWTEGLLQYYALSGVKMRSTSPGPSRTRSSSCSTTRTSVRSCGTRPASLGGRCWLPLPSPRWTHRTSTSRSAVNLPTG